MASWYQAHPSDRGAAGPHGCSFTLAGPAIFAPTCRDTISPAIGLPDPAGRRDVEPLRRSMGKPTRLTLSRSIRIVRGSTRGSAFCPHRSRPDGQRRRVRGSGAEPRTLPWPRRTRSCLLAVAVANLPFVFLGYGADSDTFAALDAGRRVLGGGGYVPSRNPATSSSKPGPPLCPGSEGRSSRTRRR